MITLGVKNMITSMMVLAGLLASGCSNSLDLREHSKDNKEDVVYQTTDSPALSLSESALAVRYVNNQDMLGSTATHAAQPMPAKNLMQQLAGRYVGQVPCNVQAKPCDQKTVDITLTLLPDGSAIRTLAQQGKVNGMLEKDTATWRVTNNGQLIMLVLPNNQIWSFRKLAPGQIRFEPKASAMLASENNLGQYILVADNT